MAASKTKTAPKSKTTKRGKTTKTTKRAPKQSAPKSSAPKKLTAAQLRKRTAELAESNRRAVELTYADGHKRTVIRPVEPVAHGRGGSVAVAEFAAAADVASSMACVDRDGQPIGRARIGTVQMSKVADALRKSKTTAHTLVGAKSAKQSLSTLKQYASAKIGRAELPDGVSQNLSDLAKSIGDPRKHKMNGRALAAAVVALSGKRGS